MNQLPYACYALLALFNSAVQTGHVWVMLSLSQAIYIA